MKRVDSLNKVQDKAARHQRATTVNKNNYYINSGKTYLGNGNYKVTCQPGC